MIVGAVNMVSCVGNVQCMDNITVDWDTTKSVVLEVDFYNANPFDKNRYIVQMRNGAQPSITIHNNRIYLRADVFNQDAHVTSQNKFSLI